MGAKPVKARKASSERRCIGESGRAMAWLGSGGTGAAVEIRERGRSGLGRCALLPAHRFGRRPDPVERELEIAAQVVQAIRGDRWIVL